MLGSYLYESLILKQTSTQRKPWFYFGLLHFIFAMLRRDNNVSITFLKTKDHGIRNNIILREWKK